MRAGTLEQAIAVRSTLDRPVCAPGGARGWYTIRFLAAVLCFVLSFAGDSVFLAASGKGEALVKIQGALLALENETVPLGIVGELLEGMLDRHDPDANDGGETADEVFGFASVLGDSGYGAIDLLSKPQEVFVEAGSGEDNPFRTLRGPPPVE